MSRIAYREDCISRSWGFFVINLLSTECVTALIGSCSSFRLRLTSLTIQSVSCDVCHATKNRVICSSHLDLDKFCNVTNVRPLTCLLDWICYINRFSPEMKRQSSQVYFRNPLTGQQMQIILYDLKASEEDLLLAWSRTARQF